MYVSSIRKGLVTRRLLFFLVPLGILFAQVAHGQSTLFIDVSPVFGHQQNIYGAANDIQFFGPDSLESDTLFVNDSFHEEHLKFNFVFENDQHKVNWENSAMLRTYRTIKAANTRNFSSELRYNYQSKERFVAGAQVRLGSYDEVDLDLITTDLLIPQSQTALFLSFTVGMKGERNKVIFTPNLHRQRFDYCLSCAYEESLPSLSSNAWNVLLSDTLLVGRGVNQQQFGFGISWGKRAFLDWENTALLNPQFPESSSSQFLAYNPDENYNPHQWSFLTVSADYTFPINAVSKLVPFLSYEQRTDLGNSDFSRNDLSAGMTLQLRLEKLRVEARGLFSNQTFTDRLTGVSGEEGRESLSYTLISAQLAASYKIAGSLYANVGGMYSSRESNELRTTTAARRSYERWGVFGGLRFLLETERSGKK